MPADLQEPLSKDIENGVVAINDGCDRSNDCDPATPDFRSSSARRMTSDTRLIPACCCGASATRGGVVVDPGCGCRGALLAQSALGEGCRLDYVATIQGLP